jgi:hypothetical protein
MALLAVRRQLGTAGIGELILMALQAPDLGSASRRHVCAQPLHVRPTRIARRVPGFLCTGAESEESQQTYGRRERRDVPTKLHDSSSVARPSMVCGQQTADLGFLAVVDRETRSAGLNRV